MADTGGVTAVSPTGTLTTTDQHIPHIFTYPPDEAGFSTTVDLIIGMIMTVSVVGGLLGNIPALVYFQTKKRQDTQVYDMLYSIISAEDTIISLLGIPVAVSLFSGRAPGLFTSYFFCASYAIIFSLVHRYLVFLVLMTSVTRTIAIFAPYHKIRTSIIRAICIAYALILTLFYVILLSTDSIVPIYNQADVYCFPIFMGSQGLIGAIWKVYTTFKLIIMLLVPLGVAVSFILSSVSLLRRKASYTVDDKRFKKVTITIALFTLTFMVCYLPSFVLHLVLAVSQWSKTIDTHFQYWYDWLVSYILLTNLNSMINPCLYYLRMPRFRRWFKDSGSKCQKFILKFASARQPSSSQDTSV